MPCIVRCTGRAASAIARVRAPEGTVRLFGVCEVLPIAAALVARGLSGERAKGLARGIAKKKAVEQVKAQARTLGSDAELRRALAAPKAADVVAKAPPSVASQMAADTSGLLPAVAGWLVPPPWHWRMSMGRGIDGGTSALVNSFSAGPTVRRGLFEYRQ